MVQTITASEARTRFGNLILQGQKGPVEITSSGKSVLIAVSPDYFKDNDELKMQLLKEKLARAQDDANNGRIVDGPEFFDDLIAEKHD